MKTECRSIYRAAFCDPDTSFEDMLFSCCFEYCNTLAVENKTVSMLFMLPIELEFSDKSIKGAYLYAAATDLAHRKKGYMSKLIDRVKRDCDFILLRPANERLIGFYASFGFKAVTAGNFSDSPQVIPQNGYKKLIDESGINDNNEQFTAMYYSKTPMNIEKIKFNYSMN